MLKSMPARIAKLPRDVRGLPITFVTLVNKDGIPDFKVVDLDKRQQAMTKRLCGICGEQLEYWMAFIGGPISCGNRFFFDPPMHIECAEYSKLVCPYLLNPKFVSSPLIEAPEFTITVDKSSIAGRPEKMGILITKGYDIVQQRGQDYFHARAAKEIRWF